MSARLYPGGLGEGQQEDSFSFETVAEHKQKAHLQAGIEGCFRAGKSFSLFSPEEKPQRIDSSGLMKEKVFLTLVYGSNTRSHRSESSFMNRPYALSSHHRPWQ